MLQEAATVVLIFRHIQCLHLINSEVAWVLVCSRTQVQPQITLDPDYLPDYIFIAYHYVLNEKTLFTTYQRYSTTNKPLE